MRNLPEGLFKTSMLCVQGKKKTCGKVVACGDAASYTKSTQHAAAVKSLLLEDAVEQMLCSPCVQKSVDVIPLYISTSHILSASHSCMQLPVRVWLKSPAWPLLPELY